MKNGKNAAYRLCMFIMAFGLSLAMMVTMLPLDWQTAYAANSGGTDSASAR